MYLIGWNVSLLLSWKDILDTWKHSTEICTCCEICARAVIMQIVNLRHLDNNNMLVLWLYLVTFKLFRIIYYMRAIIIEGAIYFSLRDKDNHNSCSWIIISISVYILYMHYELITWIIIQLHDMRNKMILSCSVLDPLANNNVVT